MPHVDVVIAALAARQQGLLSRAQLLAAGVAGHLVDHRVRIGRLQVLVRGVYRLGPLRSPREREMAAVLLCGETATLSHGSAAALWGLLPHPGEDAPVEVIVRRGYPARGADVVVHRFRTLHADETTTHEGMPVTTPGRTLLDLAGSAPSRDLEQAWARAERLDGNCRDDVARLVGRHPGRAGAPALKALMALDIGPALTRSEAEARLQALIRKGRLPRPSANAVVRGVEVDCLWRAARLAVEIDGFEFHRSRAAFEKDRGRDRALVAAGFRVMRVTWRQLTREPEAVLVQLAQALSWGGPGSAGSV